MQGIEDQLNELFIKKVPYQLPANAKTGLVKAMPWLALAGGIMAVLAAWQLYRVMTIVTTISSYYGSLYALNSPVQTINPILWVALLMLLLEGVLFFVAFPPLQTRKKTGWNLLYWVSLLNTLYGLVHLFAYMNFGSLLLSLAGSVIGLYLLFQVRSFYMPALANKATTSSSPTKK